MMSPEHAGLELRGAADRGDIIRIAGAVGPVSDTVRAGDGAVTDKAEHHTVGRRFARAGVGERSGERRASFGDSN